MRDAAPTQPYFPIVRIANLVHVGVKHTVRGPALAHYGNLLTFALSAGRFDAGVRYPPGRHFFRKVTQTSFASAVTPVGKY
jgi:hypothetical protein